MPLITVVIILILVAVVLWAINVYLSPVMDKKILWIINAVIIIAVVVWLLKLFGVWGSISTVKIG
jgi:hypothetical protein